MNPIDSSNPTGTPNPLARATKTATDPTTQVPGLSKKPQDTSQSNPTTTSSSDTQVRAQKPTPTLDVFQIANKQTRAQEVEQTRQLIAQGAYTVDLGKLADAMIKKQVIQ